MAVVHVLYHSGWQGTGMLVEPLMWTAGWMGLSVPSGPISARYVLYIKPIKHILLFHINLHKGYSLFKCQGKGWDGVLLQGLSRLGRFSFVF